MCFLTQGNFKVVYAISEHHNFKRMNKAYSKSEIIEKLKWFHGEEFDKYPLSDEFEEWCLLVKK